MNDHVFCWDGPVQLMGDHTAEVFRRGEAKVEEAADLLERATIDLPGLLEFPITRDRVRHWVDERTGDRQSAFGNTLWGTIRWDKSLGRPSTPRLADAFSLHHWYLWIEATATQGDPIVKKKWVELPQPLAWDGPHDDQSYRVSVVVRGLPGLLNRFWPEMRRDVQWEPKFDPWISVRRSFIWPKEMLPFGDFLITTGDVLVLEEEYQIIKHF